MLRASCFMICATRRVVLLGLLGCVLPCVAALAFLSGARWSLAAGGEKALVVAGQQAFHAKGCMACHSVDGSKRVGPTLKGLWGTTWKLPDGRSIQRGDAYLRQQILEPNTLVTPGYPPVMPAYKGQLDEPTLRALVAYIASLKGEQKAPSAASSRPSPTTKQASTKQVHVVALQTAPSAEEKVALNKWKKADVLALGKRSYTLNCSFCHGIKGQGDGPGGRAVRYKIRDFSKGDYLYGGSPSMLFQIISNGSPRTAVMPAWRHLPKVTRWAMVRYLLSLQGAPKPQ